MSEKVQPSRARARLLQLFEQLAQRDRAVGDALLVVMEHVAASPDSGLIAAIGTIVRHAMQQQTARESDRRTP